MDFVVKMNPTIKNYLKNMMKNPSYFITLLMLYIIPSNSLVKLSKTIESSNMQGGGQPYFTLQYSYFMIMISFFLFLAMITLTTAVLPDKMSGRCELLLANKVPINDIFKVFLNTTFILCIVPIALYNMLLIILSLVFHTKPIFELFLNIRMLFFAIVFVSFVYSILNLLIILILQIKKLEIIRSILSVSSFSFLFIVLMPVNQLQKRGLLIDFNSLTNIITVTLLMLSLVSFMVSLKLKKSLSIEKITLSFKQ